MAAFLSRVPDIRCLLIDFSLRDLKFGLLAVMRTLSPSVEGSDTDFSGGLRASGLGCSLSEHFGIMCPFISVLFRRLVPLL